MSNLYKPIAHEAMKRNRSFNQWIDIDNDNWIEELYKEYYPLPRSERHKKTFRVIVINLSIGGTINISIHKSAYSEENKLPPELAASNISEICNTLNRHKLLVLEKGCKYEGCEGITSSIQPTAKLLDSVPAGLKYQTRKEGLIRIKDPEILHLSADAEESKAVLEAYNLTVEPQNMLYATYKDDLVKDGRFTGSKVIQMSGVDRRDILIDGKATFEIDIATCLPFILYASEIGYKPSGDAYDIHGYPREVTKKSLVIALNCRSRRQTILAIQSKAKPNPLSKAKPDPLWNGVVAEDLLTEIETKHDEIIDYFYTEIGRSLMNTEARCMRTFLKEMLARGIKVYPIYDSAVCPLAERAAIKEEFIKAFTINGIPPDIHITPLAHYPQ